MKSSVLKFMKGLLTFPKTPVEFARIAVILLVVFSVLSYLGVVALPVVVEGLEVNEKKQEAEETKQDAKKEKRKQKRKKNFDELHQEMDHTHQHTMA